LMFLLKSGLPIKNVVGCIFLQRCPNVFLSSKLYGTARKSLWLYVRLTGIMELIDTLDFE